MSVQLRAAGVRWLEGAGPGANWEGIENSMQICTIMMMKKHTEVLPTKKPSLGD